MPPSTDETVIQYKQAAKAQREQIKGHPEKAKEKLIRAGIAVRSKTAPNGIKLAKRYR